MGRDNRVWYRKDTGWWMITVHGKKTRLVQGKNDRPTRKLAEKKFAEVATLSALAPEAPASRVCDVIDAFLAWTKLHRSDETNRNHVWYGQAFSEQSGELRATDLKPIHLTRWIDARGWGQTTERNARRSISRAFAWAVEQGILPRSPLAGMKCPRAKTRNRILTDAEYRGLLKAADPNFRAFLFTLRETGARPKELRTLRWEHVRPDRWVFPEHKTAHKTCKPRVVYLSAPVRKLMVVLRRRPTSGHVFLNKRGKPWTRNAVRLRIDRIRKKTGMAKDVCAYLARHTFGTQALLNGVDVATVAELLGHADLQMVSSVYLHLAEQQNHLATAADRATGRPVPAKPSPGGPS